MKKKDISYIFRETKANISNQINYNPMITMSQTTDNDITYYFDEPIDLSTLLYLSIHELLSHGHPALTVCLFLDKSIIKLDANNNITAIQLPKDFANNLSSDYYLYIYNMPINNLINSTTKLNNKLLTIDAICELLCNNYVDKIYKYSHRVPLITLLLHHNLSCNLIDTCIMYDCINALSIPVSLVIGIADGKLHTWINFDIENTITIDITAIRNGIPSKSIYDSRNDYSNYTALYTIGPY